MVADLAPAHGISSRRSLSALLSQVLVAFTVEFDNEFVGCEPPIRALTGSRAIFHGFEGTTAFFFAPLVRAVVRTKRECLRSLRTQSMGKTWL